MQTNYFKNLLAQFEKIRRHNRQGSYRTKARYAEAYQRFLRYLADEYHLQKIQNISGKHLASYVKHLQDKGSAASTIKTDISAVRFWHDVIPGAKYALPPNDNLSLERRKLAGTDRTWSDEQFRQMLDECEKAGRQDYAACMVIACHTGFRLHETMRIDKATARLALKCGAITIKGKNGKVRTVPINDAVRHEFDKFLRLTLPGKKLFVPDGKQTHIAHTELQNFIRKHRRFVPASESGVPVRYHGLRHTHAAEVFRELVGEGKSEYEAKESVSELLGHCRLDVVDVYLASVKGGGGDV